MGEIAALGAAFDAEFGKSLSSLPALEACPVTEHDAHLNHYRAAQRVTELIAYYGSRLPPYASVQRILNSADKLIRRGEHKLGKDACYAYVKAMGLHEQRGVQRMDDLSRLSYHVQASMGVETCEAALKLQADPHIKHPRTLAGIVACLKGLQDATVMVLPTEALYWLTLNGTIHMYSVAKPLLVAGFIQQVLPFLVFCVKAMETHVIFSTAKYLPWRTQLYVALCNAYFDVRAYDLARAVIQEGLDKIDALIKLQKLDPVPATPEVQAAYRTARATLAALQLRLEVISAPADAAVDAPPPPAAKAGAKGAPPPPAEDVLPPALEPLKSLLSDVSLTPLSRLTSLLEAVQVPGRRVVRHEPATGLLKALFELVAKEAAPKLAALREALAKLAEQRQRQQLGFAPTEEGDGAGAGAAQQEGAAPPTPLAGQEQPAAEGDVQADGEVDIATPAAALPLGLHKVLLCTGYNFEQPAAFQEALEVAEMRLQVTFWTHASAPAPDDPSVEALSAAAAVLKSLSQLEKQPGAEALTSMANTLLSTARTAARYLPDVLADASLVLYMTARPLLDGVYCGQDKEAGLVMLILRSLHACWQACDVDDPTARLACAIKLALLLEEQAGDPTNNTDQSGPLYEAREVLQAGVEVAERFRCESMRAARGASDEHLRWITASRSQPSDAAATLVETMSDTEQELACLHADLMAALFRVELRIGCAEQHAKSSTTLNKLQEELQKRDTQSTIFGTRTLKEKREDTARLAKVSAVPSNPPLKERELLQAVGRNPYERALLLIQMAPFQSEQHKQNALLQEAADCLIKAQASEDALFAQAQPDLRSRQAAPLQPKVLQRSPNSCTLTHFPMLLKGNKKPTKYCILAKTYGAGVGLSINKTAMEYPGTGTQVPLDKPITVEGLKRNETYIFAVAAYDDTGALIGGLGASSKEVPACLPLPLYLLWAHLLLVASRLRLWLHARRAASVLLPHFVHTSPDRPLWEASPMDAQRLERRHVDVAARPLLRAFVQAALVHIPQVLAQDVAKLPVGPLASSSPPASSSLGPEYRQAYIEEQVVRLKAVKTLQLAMEVAACLPDEMLVQEGALRMHNMLAPLLVLQLPPTQVHKALASLHLALQGVANLVQTSMVGQEANRRTSARALASATYYLVGLSSREGEATAAAHFGKLQVELLRAYDPRFTIPGRPANTSLHPEASALQDSLLSNRRLPEFGSDALAERQRDERDLAAAVLPHLVGQTPLDAWAAALGREEALDNPRWVELCVRMLEASVRRGITDGVQPIAAQVAWHVRTALQRPPLDWERWMLDDAAAVVPADVALAALPAGAVEGIGGVDAPEGLEGLSAEQRAEAEAAWERRKAEAVELGQRRVAAATLLQRRLPALLTRKRTLQAARQAAARWAPWLARMNGVLGLAAAAEGRADLLDRARRAAEQAEVLKLEEEAAAAEAEAAAIAASEAAAAAGRTSGAGRMRSPSPKGRAASPPAGAKRGGSASPRKPGTPLGKGAAQPAPPPEQGPGLEESPAMASLQHLARSTQLALRGRAWHELLNSVRHLWNVARMLLNTDAALTAETPPLEWEKGPMPPPRAAPESTIAPAAVGKDAGAKGKAGAKAAPAAKPGDKKAGSGSGSGKAGGAKAGGKDGVDGGAAGAGPEVLLPRGAKSNTARHLRSAAQALLLFVAELRAGAPLYTGVLPLLDGTAAAGAPGDPPGPDPLDPFLAAAAAAADGNTAHTPSGTLTGTGGGTAAPPPRDDDAMSYVSSAFSYGSDLQADLWYQRVSIDMAWVNRLVVLVLTVLVRMKRWHAVLELGQEWVRLSEGAFNEKVLPLMMHAAGAMGDESAGKLQAAMEVVMRDKNQALNQLDKVRTLVRKRLGDTSLLGGSGVGSKVRKRRGVGGAAVRPGTGQSAQPSLKSEASGVGGYLGNDAASMVSAAYTYGTATTFKTKASQPDYMRVPNEYEKVIEFLKTRGEKGAMILAINEMGDAHAHFGNWRGATVAWSDALDTLIGPYQVLKCWRKVLDSQSRPQILASYGLHGLLLAGGVLLGKLARYSYYDALGTRLEAARMAATLLSAVFCGSIAHPQRNRDFATYVPVSLWDGADLFADPYRCNVQDLLSGLETLATILIDNDFCLDAQPLLALWDYVSYRVARSVHHTVRCRLSRARALSKLGIVDGASRLLLDLIAGVGLPDPALDSDLVLRDEDGKPLVPPEVPSLSSSLLPGAAPNQPALTALAEAPLAPALDTLYGSWAVAHLNLARAGLLLRLGGFPHLWKATHPQTGLKITPDNPVPESKEPQLLDQAATLISRALSMAKGEPVEQGAAGGATGAGGKAEKGKAGAKAGAGKKAGDKGGGGGGSRPTSPSRSPASPSGPVVDDQTTAAQRSEVMVRALLLLSEAELLRWQPRKALDNAEAALAHIAKYAEKLNATLSDNDDTERLALSPGLWLMARMQAIRSTAALGHGPQATALIDKALDEAAKLNDPLRTAQLLHTRANLLAGRGNAAEALNTFQDVLMRYQALSLRDPRIACVLLDAATLRDALGLRTDCERLVGGAKVYLEDWTAALGLHEMQEHPELVNLYSSGTTLYALSLELSSRCSTRRQALPEAQRELEHALLLLRRTTRVLPTQQATCTLALARVMRCRAHQEAAWSAQEGGLHLGAGSGDADDGAAARDRPEGGDGDGGAAGGTYSSSAAAGAREGGGGKAAGDAAASPAAGGSGGGSALVSGARDLLEQSLTLSALDGSHQHALMREALLELASLYIAADGTEQAAAALRAAHAAAAKGTLVAMSSQLLAPVAVAQLPEWVTTFCRGQEQWFAATHGKAADAVSVSDAELGRLVVRQLLALGRASATAPVADRPRLDAQRSTLHAALKAACPRYAADACFADVPLPPPPSGAPLPNLAAGTVLVQWQVHPDGCSREHLSWVASGSLPAAGLTDSQVLGLKPVPLFVSMLYIVVPAGSGAAAAAATAAATASRASAASPSAGAKKPGTPPAAAAPAAAAADAALLAYMCIGERTFPVELVRELQGRVKALRHRLESPRAASDLFGADAPTPAELGKLRASVERLLSQRRWSADGRPMMSHSLDADDDDLLLGPADSPTSASPLGDAGKAGAGAGAARAASSASGGGAAFAALEAEVPALDVEFLKKMEAMLSLEGGLDMVDASLANWMSKLLPKRC